MALKMYTIRSGDTLSQIAVRHGFQHWKPIWNYNTKVRRPAGPFTSGNPNVIYAGSRLYIPKTLTEYDQDEKKWCRLLLQANRNATEAIDEYRSAKSEFIRVATTVDIAAAVGMPVKGAITASMRLSRRYFKLKLKKEAFRLVKDVAEVVGNLEDEIALKSLTEATVDTSILRQTGKLTLKKLGTETGKNVLRNTGRRIMLVTAKLIAPAEKQNGFSRATGLLYDFAMNAMGGAIKAFESV